jgi:CMP-N-acetylneuraminic acid synthetase
VQWLKSQKKDIPDLIVLLRPTYPDRSTIDIDNAIELFIKNYNDIDSIRSVVKSPITPYKMWNIEKKLLSPMIGSMEQELYNFPRQKLPTVYWQNACIDIIKTSVLIEKKSVSGVRILPYVMDDIEIHDIDTLKDLQYIKQRDKDEK